MKRRLILAAMLLTVSFGASADEGMWMVSNISKALEKNMKERGLKLKAGEIYNAESSQSLSDAVVSLDFGCTGSMISGQGLLITNHHCAYADVHALSTPEHNYLDEGFWAFDRKDEAPIPGKGAWFLQNVLDVTEEVNAVIAERKAHGKPVGSRAISSVMEKKYEAETGLNASLDKMWGGEKWYISLYKVYKDVRLVAAPPVSIAAFGGDVDNWEWPQQKCDFAMYRVYGAPDGSPAEYSPENVPVTPGRHLSVSQKGVKTGDFTMVIGYPGRTARYSSAAKTAHMVDITLPVCVDMRGKQMEIAKRWMNMDPKVRLLYSDWFFGLSNVQELEKGEVSCIRRFSVVDEKKELEKVLDGKILSDLGKAYDDARAPELANVWFRETLVRGARIFNTFRRICNIGKTNPNAFISIVKRDYPQFDLRVERELAELAIRKYLENVDPQMWGPFQKEMVERYGGNVKAMFDDLWANSVLTNREGIINMGSGHVSYEDVKADALMKFVLDAKPADFSDAVTKAVGEPGLLELGNRYTSALYRYRVANGIPVYPDANSTMRITYGTVGGFSPRDGVNFGWQSTSKGIVEKEDPKDYDFALKPAWSSLIRANQNLPVDFLTDNDITGGNSGSPVLNAKGELIGLAFDGNLESLASDVSYTPGYNKCICVDIRFVIWTLRNYAHADALLSEIGL